MIHFWKCASCGEEFRNDKKLDSHMAANTNHQLVTVSKQDQMLMQLETIVDILNDIAWRLENPR